MVPQVFNETSQKLLSRVNTLIAFTALIAASPASAADAGGTCSIKYSASDEISEIIKQQKFDFPGYDSLCLFMKDHALVAHIQGQSSVLAGRAIGWAMVRLFRSSAGVDSSYSEYSTHVNETPDTPSAKDALRSAINGAMEGVARHRQDQLEGIAAEEARIASLRLGEPKTR